MHGAASSPSSISSKVLLKYTHPHTHPHAPTPHALFGCSIPLSAPFGFGQHGHIDLVLRDIGIFRRHDAEQTFNGDSFGM